MLLTFKFYGLCTFLHIQCLCVSIDVFILQICQIFTVLWVLYIMRASLGFLQSPQILTRTSRRSSSTLFHCYWLLTILLRRRSVGPKSRVEILYSILKWVHFSDVCVSDHLSHCLCHECMFCCLSQGLYEDIPRRRAAASQVYVTGWFEQLQQSVTKV